MSSRGIVKRNRIVDMSQHSHVTLVKLHAVTNAQGDALNAMEVNVQCAHFRMQMGNTVS